MTTDEAQAADKQIRADVDDVLSMPNGAGKRVFAYLFKTSNYSSIVSAIDPRNAEIIPSSSAFNDGRRALYVGLRRKASYDLLKAAEELVERPLHTAPAVEKKP